MTTEKLKYKFFGLHMHQQMQVSNALGSGVYKLEGLKQADTYQCWTENGWFPMEYCELLLKPLSKLTDKDAIEVANLIAGSSISTMGMSLAINGKISVEQWQNPKPEWKVKTYIYDPVSGDTNGEHFWKTEISLDKENWVSFFHEDMTTCFHWQGDAMPVDNTVQVIDYLRSKSYALPFFGKDPFEEGWAVSKNKLT